MKFKELVMESGTVIKLAGLIGGFMVFMYTTFATIDYVDAKHKAAMGVLHQIAQDVRLVKHCVLYKKCEL